MSVPSGSDELCSAVEAALASCEADLVAVDSTLRPLTTTSLPCAEWLSGVVTGGATDLGPLIISGVLLALFTILHICRQAWYLWGGEGAFAFPFDRYVSCCLG
jgi:hypothetical protein